MSAEPMVIRMRCTDESAAQLFETWLLSEGVDCQGTDGRDVLVPTTRLPFVWDLAKAAVEQDFADEREAIESARQFLAEGGAR